jgi:hypothetical protein
MIDHKYTIIQSQPDPMSKTIDNGGPENTNMLILTGHALLPCHPRRKKCYVHPEILDQNFQNAICGPGNNGHTAYKHAKN